MMATAGLVAAEGWFGRPQEPAEQTQQQQQRQQQQQQQQQQHTWRV
jgi:hypothetical protein